MKVLLYTEGEKLFYKSGLGKAIKHQIKALSSANIEYTTNVYDEYDIIHINFYGPNSYRLAKLAKKKKITQVVFDRGGYLYTGRVKELADGARAGGLEF